MAGKPFPNNTNIIEPLSMFSPEFTISKGNTNFNAVYEAILRIGKPMTVPKGKAIIRHGSYSNFFFYIRSGVFRSYTVVNGKEYGIGFTFQDDIDCCPQGLFSGIPNNYTIEAVRDSEVLVCDYKEFKILGNEKHEQMLNDLLTHYLGIVENRLIEAISLTAEERYLRLMETHPEKLNLIPLSHVASYLGISQERLSRIRRKLT